MRGLWAGLVSRRVPIFTRKPYRGVVPMYRPKSWWRWLANMWAWFRCCPVLRPVWLDSHDWAESCLGGLYCRTCGIQVHIDKKPVAGPYR